MLAPTPMLRPGPLDISGIFAGTFEVLKRRFGLFVMITLFPVVLGVLLIIVGVVILITSFAISAPGNQTGVPVGLLVGGVFYFLGILAAGLGQLKSYAMMTVGAYEIAQGQRPDFRGLLTRTRGFLPRMVPVIALAIVCGVLITGAFFALAGGSIAAIVASQRTGEGSPAAAGLLGAMVLFFLLLLPLSYFLQTKLLYTIPASAIEEVGGIEGMKRSWRLTNGAFWRTLGYYLVATIAISILSSTISGVGQVAMMPMLASIGSTTNSSDPAAAMAAVGAMIPFFVIMFILVLVVSILSVPFLQTYITYMYIDQVRRSEMPGAGQTRGGESYYAPPGQYYGQPGQYNGQPGQYYGQPGQYNGQPGQYPQQGQQYGQPGQQPYGQPGTGYPPPGQYPQPGSWQVPPQPGGQNPPQAGPPQPPQ